MIVKKMKVMLLNPPSKYAKNVVRDLIYGCWCKGKRIASASFPPTSLLLLSAVLKKEGHDVILLDSQAERKDLKEVKKDVKKKNPEILVIPTSTMSFNEDVETLKKIKKVVNVITLAFGSHVTFLPLASLERDGIDYLVMREPEYVIRDFVNAVAKKKDPRKIKGLAYKRGKKKIINNPYPFIKNLDELPFPDRTQILKYAYFNPIVKKIPWTTAFTSRGCPGRCNFCTSPAFYGRKLRFRSPESVVKEMEEIKDLGYKEVFFRDETFTANKIRLIKICKLILERKLEISWICNARIGNLDKKIMKLMEKAGCHYIKFGVESGVQKILDNIKKDIDAKMTRKTFKWANEIGMGTHAHLMFGCIGETKESIEKTIQFIKEINPTRNWRWY